MKKHEIANVLKLLDTIPLPNKEKLLSSCPQQADSSIVVSSIVYRHKFRIKLLIATCTALLLLISGFSAYAITNEVKEYNEAVIFFM